MKKNKAILWPYSENEYALAKYDNYLYEVTDLFAPIGWGGISKDAGEHYNKQKLYKNINDDATMDLEKINIIIISESVNLLDFDNYVLPMIIIFEKYNIEIVSLFLFNDKQTKEINEIYEKNKTKFKVVDNDIKLKPHNYEGLFQINIPIIFVMSAGENLGKVDTEIMLYNEISKMGFNVKLIGSNNYSYLWDGETFPSFDNGDIRLEKKVLAFNRYIKKIETERKSDIIIIGIPGGLFTLSREIPNGFGLSLYFASLAVTPDFSVVNILHSDYSKEYIELMDNLFLYRYGYKVNCWVMRNKIFDTQESLITNKMIELCIDNDYNNEKIKQLRNEGLPFYFEEEVIDVLKDTMDEYAEIGAI